MVGVAPILEPVGGAEQGQEKYLGEEDRRQRVHLKRKRAPGHRPATLERRGGTGTQTREGANEAQEAAAPEQHRRHPLSELRLPAEKKPRYPGKAGDQDRRISTVTH